MNQDLPSSKFDEKEVDHLIADFGAKPSQEKRQELQNLLGKQKEKVFAREHRHYNDNRERE